MFVIGKLLRYILYLSVFSMYACGSSRQLKDVDMAIVSDDSLLGAYVKYVPTMDTLKYTNVDLGLFIPYLAAYKMTTKKDKIQFYSFMATTELPETSSKTKWLSERTRERILEGEYSIILCRRVSNNYLPIKKVELSNKGFVLDFYNTDLYYMIFFKKYQFGSVYSIKSVYDYYRQK